MKIYDCFMFYNEFELLKFRLEYLKNHVDYFVIVEGNTTFSGNPKNQNFDINLFDKEIQSKIRYQYLSYPLNNDPIWNEINTVISDNNDENNILAWKKEYWTRNQLLNDLYDANEEDIIMLSDVDEIPDIKILENLNWISEIISHHGVITLDLDIFHYNINGFLLNQDGTRHSCPSFKLTNKKFLNNTNTNMPTLRGIPGAYLSNSGWHFSYFGGAEKIKNKIKSFSHTEQNKDSIIDNVDNFVKTSTPMHHYIVLSNQYNRDWLPSLIFTDEFKDFFEGNFN